MLRPYNGSRSWTCSPAMPCSFSSRSRRWGRKWSARGPRRPTISRSRGGWARSRRREALFVDPAAWRAQLVRFPRIALDPADADARFPIAPPEPVDRDIKRLRQVVATEPPTVILCDNEGQLERLEELLA